MSKSPLQTSKKNTIISFIIPTYNSERTIGNCIKSILSQRVKGVEKEIIVVDDRSEDRTVEIAKRLGAKVIVRGRRSGRVGGLNVGIGVARGKLLALIDSDVYPMPDWLEASLAEIKMGADGVHPANVTYQPDKVFRQFARLWLIKGFAPPTLGDASLVRREVFDEIGLHDEWFAPIGGEDFEIALRAQKAGFKIVQSADAKYFHDFAAPRRWRDKIRRTVLYESGRVKAWLMHLDYSPARIGLINDWFWSMMFPLLLVLRKLLVKRWEVTVCDRD
jgi:glycosyltransferase involved in cell wall biosynthesis